MDTTQGLFELLRDDQDIRELLVVFGQDPPEDFKEARNRLLSIVAELGQSHVISMLLRHARNFALMSEEIFALCAEAGVGISGQIQVKVEGIFLKQNELNSGWAFTSGGSRGPEIEGRANAIAGELYALAERVRLEELEKTVTKRESSELLSFLRESPDPRHQAAADEMEEDLTEYGSHQGFAEEDYNTLRTLAATLADAGAVLSRTPLPPSIIAAVAEFEVRCQQAAQQMESNCEAIPATPELSVLVEETQLLTTLIRSVAEEAANAERVEREFADFLQTDFWFQRWRIYELWLLARILRVMQGAGGQIELSGVEAGAWTLKFGRARHPVARCTFDSRILEVYYQLYQEKNSADKLTPHPNKRSPSKNKKTKAADMPDIAVLIPNDGAVLVLDPKHGRSYSRGKVMDVLNEYSSNPKLHPDLTAIVNYFRMNDYPPHDVSQTCRSLLLTSEVCPGGRGLAQLEHRFASALRQRGYKSKSRTAQKPKVRPTAQRPKSAHLVYWANQNREVDEPRGFWAILDQGEPVHLEAMDKLIAEGPAAIDATASGEACVLVGEKRLVVINAQNERVIELDRAVRGPGWDSAGLRYAFVAKSCKGIQIIDVNAKDKDEIPFPDDKPDLALGLFGWAGDGKSLLCAVRTDGEIKVFQLREFREWIQIGEVRRSQDVHMQWAGPEIGPLLYSGSHTFQLLPDIKEVEQRVLSTSHNGLYRVLTGPDSLQGKDVTLLEVKKCKDESAQLPYVRLFGSLEREREMRWSPGENRFAFLARGTDRSAEPRLFMARVGDKFAFPVSWPRQEPTQFAWLAHSVIKRFIPTQAEVKGVN